MGRRLVSRFINSTTQLNTSVLVAIVQPSSGSVSGVLTGKVFQEG